MAKVNEGLLKQWADGETMHGSDYNAERLLIVRALNDADARIDGVAGSGGVTNAMLAAGSVTNSKLAANAVTGDKIAANSIGNAHLTERLITSDKIANDAVGTSQLANSGVTADKLAPNAVTSIKIANNSVLTEKLADTSVTTTKLADNSVASRNIMDGSVTSSKMTSGAVGTGQIADGAVTTPKLANGAVTPDKITAAAVHAHAYSKSETEVLIADAVAGGIDPAIVQNIRDTIAQDIVDLDNDLYLLESWVEGIGEIVDDHTGNSVRHITAAERTAWNAKETTSGAQTKADTAENNAKSTSLQKTGGTMTGTTTYTTELPIATNISGKKSWGHHHSSATGDYYIVPSATVGATDWQYNKGLRVSEDNVYWAGGDLNSLKQSGVDAKAAVVASINAMGGSATVADTWEQLALKIRQISTLTRLTLAFHETITHTVEPGNPSTSEVVTIATFPAGTKHIDYHASGTLDTYLQLTITAGTASGSSSCSIGFMDDSNRYWRGPNIDTASPGTFRFAALQINVENLTGMRDGNSFSTAPTDFNRNGVLRLVLVRSYNIAATAYTVNLVGRMTGKLNYV